VTQNVYVKSWWEERVDAVIEAVEAAAQNAEIEAKKNRPESVSNGCSFTLQVAIGGISRAAYSPLRGMSELSHCVSRVP
jgi:hypothetical protein